MARKVWYADKPLNEWPVNVLENTIEVLRSNVGEYNPDALANFEQALKEAKERK